MNAPPRLIVTLPARTVTDARSQASEAASAGADMVEVRLDRWSAQERERIGELFPLALPALATYRSREEGGEAADPPEARASALAHIAGFPFALVDLELARDPPPVRPVGDPPNRWMGSRHFAEGTSLEEIEATLRPPDPSFEWIKIVLPASISRFLREFLPRLSGWVGPKTAVFTTGASGPLARTWARELGEPVVFASLPDSGGPDRTAPVEPSQVPVDQLHRSWAVGEGRRFAVLGHPIAHSLSPAIHAGWLASEGRAASFVALDVLDEAEFRLLAASSSLGRGDGWSVTAPWKPLAAKLASHPSPAVRATGVANTLTFRAGRTEAELTDAAAVQRRALELVVAGRWDGKETLVFGTGGAARAAVFALAAHQRSVWLLGRRPEAVERLSRSVGGRPGVVADRHPVGLMVHATTLGRSGSGPLEPSLAGWVGPGTVVLDFVYSAADPSLRLTVEAAGASYEDGRRLLVYQAAEAHRIWWGSPPNPEAIDFALRRVGCAE
jgi:shikimate 5-dehydrogenase/3-dehydroquinate dehydratase